MKPKAYRERIDQMRAEEARQEPLTPDPDEVLPGPAMFGPAIRVADPEPTADEIRALAAEDDGVAFSACAFCGANPHAVPCPCGGAE